MLLKNKKIAIIGAGPVGLTMARLLQQKGNDVTVYERDKDANARIWGGTLDLHKGSGQDAMKEAGLLERYYEMALPMGRTVADEKGTVLFTKNALPEEQFDNPEINRNDLRKMLLESLHKNTVIWDSKLIELKEYSGKWLLHFENNETLTADFVIGANGGMTKLREYITNAAVETTGTFIIQGEVQEAEIKCPDFLKLCNDTILMTSKNGDMLVANPKNNKALSYSVIFKTPEEFKKSPLNFQDTESVISFLFNKFSVWNDSYKQLFQSTTFFAGLPTKKIAVNIPWKTNRPLPITLIGDAAHLMPPFAGQGANIGLVDALILSKNLNSDGFETIEDAIYDYEQQMFVYANEAQSETSKNEITMLNPDFSFLNFVD